jgi:hypothetical protein
MSRAIEHHWIRRRTDRNVLRWQMLCYVIALAGAIGWIIAIALAIRCWTH